MAHPKTDEGPKDDTPRKGGGSPSRGKSSKRRRRTFLAALGALFFVALAIWFLVIPYPRGLAEGNPETTALIEQRMDEARTAGDSLEIRRTWVPLDRISRNLVRAVVVAEDYRFRQHEGIDWVSLAEEVEWSGDDDFSWLDPSDLAALVDAAAFVWANRSELRGRSTLTQQLAKNLYFGTDRTLLRKAMEAVVARRLERTLSKDRILELYLNIAEWGPGIFGAEAAARAYFGRSAAELTLDQAAALAATLPHPLTSNPARSPSRMAWRKELILDRIDPSRGIPTEPMPLPEPRFDVGLPGLDSLPGRPSPGLDTLDTLGGARPGDTLSDTLSLPDTTAPGATTPDMTVSDTTTPDTTVSDTIRPDTTVLPMPAARP